MNHLVWSSLFIAVFVISSVTSDDVECEFQVGSGREKIYMGALNQVACVDKCGHERQKDKTINGAEVYSNSNIKGCWCLKGMPNRDQNPDKKSCIIYDCPISEYECEAGKYQPGENTETVYGVSEGLCAMMCCSRQWCVGFDYTKNESRRCHLSEFKRTVLALLSSDLETKQCQKKVSGWSQWSSCSATCGLTGKATRTRDCLLASNDCTAKGLGVLLEERACNNVYCPDCSNFEYDCKDGEKQSMSNPLKIIAGISQDQCSLECCKTDTCVGYNYGLDKTCVLSSELRSSAAPASSVGTKQCQRLVGTWGAWSGCSKTCGRDGKKERTRAWTGAGVSHLELKQIQNCYAPPCSECVAEHFDCRVDKTQSVTFFASYSFAEEKDCTSRCCRNQECAGYSIDKNQKRCYLSKYKRSQANLYYKVGVTQCEKPTGWESWSSCNARCGTYGTMTRKRTGSSTTEERVCEPSPCPGCNIADYDCQANRGQDGATFAEFTDATEVQCSRYCCLDKDCKAYTYTASTKMCKLSKQSTSQYLLTIRSGARFCQKKANTVSTFADCQLQKQQPNAQITKIENVDTATCNSECYKNPECVGFSHDDKMKICYLSRYDTTVVPLRMGINKRYCARNINDLSGQWGSWQVTTCSVTCGDGVKTKSRWCNNPTAMRKCLSADGIRRQYERTFEKCNTQACRDDGTWGAWKVETCSKTCDTGTQNKYRTCETNDNCLRGDGTRGKVEAMKVPCLIKPCPAYGGWSSWFTTACDKSCGSGTQTKHRTCNNPTPGPNDMQCLTTSNEQSSVEILRNQPCNTQACPANGGWSTWQVTQACSKSCGGGFQMSQRWCNNPTPIATGLPCLTRSGSRSTYEAISVACNTQECGVNGNWGSWQTYACSRSCGTGTQTKFRSCNDPAPRGGGQYCLTANAARRSYEYQTGYCNTQTCQVNGGWGSWEAYACSKSCGAGTQTKYRTCNNPSPSGGLYCLMANGGRGYREYQTGYCNSQRCSVLSGGTWSTWYLYACSKQCGGGIQMRIRYCQSGQNCVASDGTRKFYDYTTQPCNQQRC